MNIADRVSDLQEFTRNFNRFALFSSNFQVLIEVSEFRVHANVLNELEIGVGEFAGNLRISMILGFLEFLNIMDARI